MTIGFSLVALLATFGAFYLYYDKKYELQAVHEKPNQGAPGRTRHDAGTTRRAGRRHAEHDHIHREGQVLPVAQGSGSESPAFSA